MLRKAEIKKLFGIYSYTIDLVNDDAYPLRFITGPNGSGKSTLLKLLFALFNRQYQKFYNIEFDELNLWFDEEEFQILQQRKYDSDDSSDEFSPIEVLLRVTYKKAQQVVEVFEAKPDGKWGGMTEMFFQSYPIFFINDERNIYLKSDYHKNHDNDVCARLAMDIDEFVRQLKANVVDIPFNAEPGALISRGEYEAEVQALMPQINKLKKWGLVKQDFKFLTYVDALSEFLREYLEQAHALLKSDFIQRVELFEETINAFTFINKHLEIDPISGFYFVMDEIDRPPLIPEQLSSGERHLLLQVYELLFMAPPQSLVLLDEPELSMHMYWQINYAKLMAKIAEVRKLQVIVATHSTRIFNQIWEHSADLYRLSKAEKSK